MLVGSAGNSLLGWSTDDRVSIGTRRRPKSPYFHRVPSMEPVKKEKVGVFPRLWQSKREIHRSVRALCLFELPTIDRPSPRARNVCKGYCEETWGRTISLWSCGKKLLEALLMSITLAVLGCLHCHDQLSCREAQHGLCFSWVWSLHYSSS